MNDNAQSTLFQGSKPAADLFDTRRREQEARALHDSLVEFAELHGVSRYPEGTFRLRLEMAVAKGGWR